MRPVSVKESYQIGDELSPEQYVLSIKRWPVPGYGEYGVQYAIEDDYFAIKFSERNIRALFRALATILGDDNGKPT